MQTDRRLSPTHDPTLRAVTIFDFDFAVPPNMPDSTSCPAATCPNARQAGGATAGGRRSQHPGEQPPRASQQRRQEKGQVLRPAGPAAVMAKNGCAASSTSSCPSYISAQRMHLLRGRVLMVFAVEMRRNWVGWDGMGSCKIVPRGWCFMYDARVGVWDGVCLSRRPCGRRHHLVCRGGGGISCIPGV